MSRQHPKKLKVLHVVSAVGIGGAETWLLSLAKHTARDAHVDGVEVEYDILLTGEDQGALEGEFQACGVELIRIPFSRRTLPGFTVSFRELLRTGRYDAIHDHQDYSAGLHFLAGAGELPPVRIIHIHNSLLHIQNYSKGPARRATASLGRYCLSRFPTHVLGTSDQLLREYGFDSPRFAHQMVRPLYCGIDTSMFRGNYETSRKQVLAELGLPSDSTIVLFVGRLDSGSPNQKNPQFALETAREVVNRFPGAVFLMAGEYGGVGANLVRAGEEWGMGAKMRIVGPRRDVSRLMAAAGLLLVPSLQEGLGMVIVEAQAAGLPVLASDFIPRECVVVQGLVDFLPLSAGVEIWARTAIEKLSKGRPSGAAANEAVRRSPFSIQSSARALVEIYSGARPDGS